MSLQPLELREAAMLYQINTRVILGEVRHRATLDNLPDALWDALAGHAAHWVYLLGVAVIVITMIQRANVVVPSIAATFLVTLAWTQNSVTALGSIFNASFTAAKELFNIFLVIALMTALLNALKMLRSDIRMVEPFRAVMKNGHAAYFVLAGITYVISLFFWPTPAVPAPGAWPAQRR